MALNAEIISGFVESVLAKNFAERVPTPDFHKEIWEYCCNKHRFVAIAAPRGHGKSTAITHAYTLAAILFRERKFVILISDTETQAVMFLQDIKKELEENEDLVNLFGLKKDNLGKTKFVKDTESDLIVSFKDGGKFRIVAKGSEQKVRGLKWGNQRPDLIICHEKGTEIYTPETGWILNTDYPEAKEIWSHDAYEVEFENGLMEVVSGDHQYLVEGEWKFPWEIKSGENVIENINDNILNDILIAEKKVSRNTTIKQKLRNVYDNGIKTILIMSLLQERSGIDKIMIWCAKKLVNLLKNILPGKLSVVQNVEP